jgi:hypothetical protein
MRAPDRQLANTSSCARARRATPAAWRLAIALCSALSVASVAGLSGAEPTAGEKETARQLFNEASDLRDKGNVREALAKFKLAHSLGHTPITGFELGKMHLLVGELLEAREAFLSVARIEKKPSESAASVEARTQAAQLAEELKPRLPSITVKLSGLSEGETAAVTLDHNPVKPAALAAPIKVNPGTHVVVVQVAGRSAQRLEVTVKEGELLDLPIAFTGQATTAAASEAPAQGAVGTAKRRPPPMLSYVGFGVGGAGLLFGGITGVLALSKTSATKAECPDNICPPSQHDSLDASKSLAVMSTVGFAVAGVGVAAGIVGLLTRSKEAPVAPSTATVKPVLGPGYAGLYGRF